MADHQAVNAPSRMARVLAAAGVLCATHSVATLTPPDRPEITTCGCRGASGKDNCFAQDTELNKCLDGTANRSSTLPLAGETALKHRWSCGSTIGSCASIQVFADSACSVHLGADSVVCGGCNALGSGPGDTTATLSAAVKVDCDANTNVLFVSRCVSPTCGGSCTTPPVAVGRQECAPIGGGMWVLTDDIRPCPSVRYQEFLVSSAKTACPAPTADGSPATTAGVEVLADMLVEDSTCGYGAARLRCPSPPDVPPLPESQRKSVRVKQCATGSDCTQSCKSTHVPSGFCSPGAYGGSVVTCTGEVGDCAHTLTFGKPRASGGTPGCAPEAYQSSDYTPCAVCKFAGGSYYQTVCNKTDGSAAVYKCTDATCSACALHQSRPQNECVLDSWRNLMNVGITRCRLNDHNYFSTNACNSGGANTKAKVPDARCSNNAEISCGSFATQPVSTTSCAAGGSKQDYVAGQCVAAPSQFQTATWGSLKTARARCSSHYSHCAVFTVFPGAAPGACAGGAVTPPASHSAVCGSFISASGGKVAYVTCDLAARTVTLKACTGEGAAAAKSSACAGGDFSTHTANECKSTTALDGTNTQAVFLHGMYQCDTAQLMLYASAETGEAGCKTAAAIVDVPSRSACASRTSDDIVTCGDAAGVLPAGEDRPVSVIRTKCSDDKCTAGCAASIVTPGSCVTDGPGRSVRVTCGQRAGMCATGISFPGVDCASSSSSRTASYECGTCEFAASANEWRKVVCDATGSVSVVSCPSSDCSSCSDSTKLVVKRDPHKCTDAVLPGEQKSVMFVGVQPCTASRVQVFKSEDCAAGTEEMSASIMEGTCASAVTSVFECTTAHHPITVSSATVNAVRCPSEDECARRGPFKQSECQPSIASSASFAATCDASDRMCAVFANWKACSAKPVLIGMDTYVCGSLYRDAKPSGDTGEQFMSASCDFERKTVTVTSKCPDATGRGCTGPTHYYTRGVCASRYNWKGQYELLDIVPCRSAVLLQSRTPDSCAGSTDINVDVPQGALSRRTEWSMLKCDSYTAPAVPALSGARGTICNNGAGRNPICAAPHDKPAQCATVDEHTAGECAALTAGPIADAAASASGSDATVSIAAVRIHKDSAAPQMCAVVADRGVANCTKPVTSLLTLPCGRCVRLPDGSSATVTCPTTEMSAASATSAIVTPCPGGCDTEGIACSGQPGSSRTSMALHACTTTMQLTAVVPCMAITVSAFGTSGCSAESRRWTSSFASGQCDGARSFEIVAASVPPPVPTRNLPAVGSKYFQLNFAEHRFAMASFKAGLAEMGVLYSAETVAIYEADAAAGVLKFAFVGPDAATNTQKLLDAMQADSAGTAQTFGAAGMSQNIVGDNAAGGDGGSSKTGLIVGLVVGAAVLVGLLVAAGLVWHCCCRSRPRHSGFSETQASGDTEIQTGESRDPFDSVVTSKK